MILPDSLSVNSKQRHKHDLTVCCECMFGWYWLADACQGAGLTFVLAHQTKKVAAREYESHARSQGPAK